MNFHRMGLTVSLATFGLFAAFAPSSSAALITIGNSSFEAPLHPPVSTDPQYGNYSHDFFDPTPGATQWVLGNGATGGEYIPIVGPVGPPGATVYNSLAPKQAGQATQSQIMYLDFGSVSQILTSTLSPSLLYTLTFYQGERLEKDQEPNFTYSLGVISGGAFVPLVQQQVQGFLFGTPGHPGSPSGTFSPLQLTFDSSSPSASPFLGSQLAIMINNQGSSIGGLAQLDLDNFSLDVVANPEPASLALMGLGAAALAIARKRSSSR